MTPRNQASPRLRRARRVAAAVLAGLFAVLLPVAITAAWVRVTVLSTSGYVAAVAPVAADPAVRSIVKAAATAEVGPALTRAAATSLPSRLAFLAGPLGNGLAVLIGDGIDRAMDSPEFQRLWQAANTTAHSQLISVLDGRSSAVAATGGQVVLNLIPLVNEALKQAASRLSAMTGTTVRAPVITRIPAAACRQAARLAHTNLPADCGQVPLFPATALTGPQHAFRLLNDATLALLLLTPAAGAAALLCSPGRRRTLLALTVAATVTLLATVIALTRAQSALAAQEPAAYQPAVTAIVHSLTGTFFNLAWWHIAAGLITAAALLAASVTAAIKTRKRPAAVP
jgi:hypothetical protein